jgi:hypothetical protein
MKRLLELILYGLHHTIDHTNERRMNNCTDTTHVAQRNFSKTNNYKSNEPNLQCHNCDSNIGLIYITN